MIDFGVPTKIRWKLDDLLDEHDLTLYQLGGAMAGLDVSNRNMLYRLQKSVRIDVTTLERIIDGLEKLTGKQFGVCDLLEYER